MSILIKGMEMPTSCNACMFDVYGLCLINKYIECKDELTHSCPLVPVSPHGDLIDRDAMRSSMPPCFTMEEIVKAFKNAPTIIPAEEGAKAEKDTEPWLCLSCRHYPPSSTDSKPCSQCNPSEVLHSCYDPAEEGE